MSGVIDEEVTQESSLGMSDEDFSKMGAPVEAAIAEEAVPEAVEVESVEVTAETALVDEVATEDAEAIPVVEPVVPEMDYKAAYEKMLAPFKANGREIAVDNVDDAISLMQMGANYNKKMAALKPNLKLMKLLEQNNLLDQERLSFLIDLEKKDPAAISKLIKDSGIDPLDLDAEKASGYAPKSRVVDDREIELDTVLDELQSSPTYNRTLDIVGNQWDGASKQTIAGSPQLLKVINGHVASGVYDTITKEMEKERMFGRLNGLSDIEAYRQVGDAIQARGGFNSVGHPEKTTPAAVVVPPNPKQVDDSKLNDKRRAASSPRPAAPGAPAKDFNPLSMSDEEFSKQVNHKFL